MVRTMTGTCASPRAAALSAGDRCAHPQARGFAGPGDAPQLARNRLANGAATFTSEPGRMRNITATVAAERSSSSRTTPAAPEIDRKDQLAVLSETAAGVRGAGVRDD